MCIRITAERGCKGTGCWRVGLILVVLIAGMISFGAGRNIPGQEELRHETTVTLKLVQVYVTNERGEPVTDLDKDDFEIFDNGKPQTITDFERHLLAPSPDIPKDAGAGTEGVGRKIFFFFDFAYNSVHGIQKSREAALHFLDTQVLASDEIGMISYSAQSGLTLHEDLTSDHAKVRRSLEGINPSDVLKEAESIFGEPGKVVAPRSSVDVTLMSLDARAEYEMKHNPANELHDSQIISNILQLNELAKALSHIPGYKQILFFSAGLQIGNPVMSKVSTGREARLVPPNSYPEMVKRFEQMVRELASSGCAVFVMDVNAPGVTIHTRESGITGVDTLRSLATRTGGRYFGNIERFEDSLEEIQRLTGCYYILGYVMGRETDGKYHRIEIKAKRPGLRTLAQAGYYQPKPFRKYSTLEKKLQLLNLAVGGDKNKLSADIPARSVLSFDGDTPLGLVFFKIPGYAVSEISCPQLEITSFVLDGKNQVLDSRRAVVNSSKFPEKSILYYSLLIPPLDESTLRVIFRNLQTGRALVASSPVAPRPHPEDKLRISHPLLLVGESKAFYLQGIGPERKGHGAIPLSAVCAYPLDEYAPLLDDLPSGTSTLQAVVKCRVPGISQPKLRISARLTHRQSGNALPLELSMKSKKIEADHHLFLTIQTQALVAGDYILDILVVDESTGDQSIGTTEFSLS